MAERGEGKQPEECGCGISFGKTGGIGVQATETLPELTGDNAL